MKVNLIGSGNVAALLAAYFAKAGIELASVCSRNTDHARSLAERYHAPAVSQIGDMAKDADCWFIAVSDDAIAEVAAQIPTAALVVHTSGMAGLEVIHRTHRRCGVFYPLQTIAAGVVLDAKQVPWLIEASNPEVLAELDSLARKFGGAVFEIDSERRQYLHLAAVLVNNFTNHLGTLASDILLERGLPFDLLKPLILETARRMTLYPPDTIQTGPAKRGDESTLAKHKALISTHPELLKVYEALTASIKKRQGN